MTWRGSRRRCGPSWAVAERRVVAILQARVGSTRLPGKVLERIGGHTLLELSIARARAARCIDAVWLATTERPEDDVLAAEAARLGVPCFRGSEDDVLARYAGAMAAADADVVVRLTADNPLLPTEEVERVVRVFLEADPPLDYAANMAAGARRVPLGTSVEVARREALERAHREAGATYQREHVMPYLYEESGRFRVLVTHPEGPDRSAYRVTVDTPEDLFVVRELAQLLGDEPPTLARLAELLDAHPELAAHNGAVRQKSFREAAAPRRTLLLRADASPAIGTGHVMRCLAIAEAFRERGGRVVLASSALAPALAERAQGLGVELVSLPSSVLAASLDDAAFTAARARSLAPASVLVDGYSFEAPYLRALAGPGVAVALVDDHGLPALPVALVLNPNAGASAATYPAPHPAVVLAGAPFAPLRAEYRRAVVPERSFAPPLHLLITFGGSDPLGLTLPTLGAALELAASGGPLRAITVLAGALCAVVEALHDAAASAPPGLVSLCFGVSEMAALLASVDLAVGAAGSTSWELAHLGVPMLIGAVAENQRAVVTPLVEVGAAWALGEGDELASPRLAERLRAFVAAGPALHRAMSARGRALIDARGAERVAAALETLEVP